MTRESKVKLNKMKRQRELQIKIALTAFMIIIIVFLVVLFGSFFSKAASNDLNTTYYKYYTSIEVHSGDTLWSIANTYCDSNFDSMNAYISEVKSINSLTQEQIIAGQYLIIPYYTTEFRT